MRLEIQKHFEKLSILNNQSLNYKDSTVLLYVILSFNLKSQNSLITILLLNVLYWMNVLCQ